MHERASTSVGGPVDDLFTWAMRDVRTWNQQPLAVYDRHPLVSEYIYGPIIRNHVDPKFIRAGTAPVMRDFLNNSLLIFCLPNFETVQVNAGSDDQMPGVVDHLEGIYVSYWHSYLTMQPRPFRYDFTRSGSYQEVKAMVRMHMANWKRSHSA